MAWRRFVAIGDSLTEGVGDPVVGGGLRGWADRLAAALRELEPDLTYINLARRSLRTAEIHSQQVPVALELQPDLVAAVMGMNDLIRPDFDGESFRADLSQVIRPFIERGSTVLMGSLPDVSRYLLARDRIKTPLRERLQIAAEAPIALPRSKEHCSWTGGAWNLRALETCSASTASIRTHAATC